MDRTTLKHATWIEVAYTIANLATCARRKVGCVLLNEHGHVIATGYNGPAAGVPNCIDDPCPGAHYPSGQGLEECVAIHAEANALLQCRDHRAIAVAYVTAFPCIHCVKLLRNTSCQLIVFGEDYAHPPAKTLWQADRELLHVPRNLTGAHPPLTRTDR